MKKFCRYAVIDIRTGSLLVCGQKYKDFNSCNVRYVYSGTFKTFHLFGRTITEYFRTVEIKGHECCIVYWVQNKGKRFYNCVTTSGRFLNLRGRVYDFSGVNSYDVYRKFLVWVGSYK